MKSFVDNSDLTVGTKVHAVISKSNGHKLASTSITRKQNKKGNKYFCLNNASESIVIPVPRTDNSTIPSLHSDSGWSAVGQNFI